MTFHRRSTFNLVFGFLGSVLVLFVVFPLASALLASSPQELWVTLKDPEVYRSIGLTFGAAALATVIALVCGVPLAYLLARRNFRGKNLVEGVIMLPVVTPHTAAGVALLLVFGRRGWVGQFFEPLGLRFTDSLAGIVVAMLFVSLPFLVTAAQEAFALIDEELERVALIDGASAWQAFRFVSLPLAARGIAAGAVLMWARGISEFGAVVILVYHPKIMPVLIYERFEGFGLPAALPAAALLILSALAAFSLVRFGLRAADKNP